MISFHRIDHETIPLWPRIGDELTQKGRYFKYRIWKDLHESTRNNRHEPKRNYHQHWKRRIINEPQELISNYIVNHGSMTWLRLYCKTNFRVLNFWKIQKLIGVKSVQVNYWQSIQSKLTVVRRKYPNTVRNDRRYSKVARGHYIPDNFTGI